MNKKYLPRDYAKLTPNQKQKLFRLQRNSRSATQKTSANSARIAALESQLKAQSEKDSDEGDLFADSEDSNLNNSALARQTKKPRRGN